MCRSMVDIQSATGQIKKIERKKIETRMSEILSALCIGHSYVYPPAFSVQLTVMAAQ